MTPPLAGIRVLELARILAGPWAGQNLADLGAEVIKIESPHGDDNSAAYFHSCNRGKQSITVDFRTPEGQAQIKALAAEADIIIENFKCGGLAKYGLDYNNLRQFNPGLIYCSITGFGQTGPYAHRAGYDYIIQGMSGLMSVTGPPDGQPQKVGVAVTDILTGLYAVNAILAALHLRGQTGQGQHIDLALLDVAVACMANQAMNYLTTGHAPGRIGNAHQNLAPYQVFDCADGWVIIAVGNDGQFQRLCDILGVAGLACAPDYKTNADRVANRDRLTALLTACTQQHKKADLLAACHAQGVPAGPINNLAEVFDDPQVQARGLSMTMDGIAGDGIAGLRPPYRFSDADLALDRPAPILGQDNGNVGFAPRPDVTQDIVKP